MLCHRQLLVNLYQDKDYEEEATQQFMDERADKEIVVKCQHLQVEGVKVHQQGSDVGSYDLTHNVENAE